MPPETRELAEGYGRTLTEYLRQRTPSTTRLKRHQHIEPSVRMIVSGTLRDLDELDEQRAALRQRLESGEGSDATGASVPATVQNGGPDSSAVKR